MAQRRLCLGMVLIGLAFQGCAQSGKPYQSPLTFEGGSDALQSTVIVPTLDTPAPAGKNVIWCVGFELAWNHLRSDVVKGPVMVSGAQTVTDRLNVLTPSEGDLAPESCFAIAGLASEGIRKRIAKEMAARFPKQPPPEIDVDAAVVAYAYLNAAARFTIPFFENDAELAFADSDGKRTAIASFGVRPKDEYAYARLRKQVEILYEKEPATPREELVNHHVVKPEFALDPCRTSTPYQVILAIVARKETLGATVDDLMAKIAAWSPRTKVDFGPNDVLLIPNLHWKITHHFRELEGTDKTLLNPGFEKLWIDTAMEALEFRLDRGGVELAAESKVYAKPIPTYFVFDRPFLVCLKKRGAGRPFFVMWVENAELLGKNPARSAVR